MNSKVYVTKRFTFEACHNLPDYDGDCSRLHGHSYKLEVTLSGRIDRNTGMVLDFKKLKSIVGQSTINILDHEYLNKFYGNPTAENMVTDFFYRIAQALPSHIALESVKLWETGDSYAEYRGERY